MRYRTFGRTGWKVSEIGFGAWAIGGGWGPQEESESVAALNRALDLGCNFIDTAQGYGNGRSERIIAQVLKSRGSGARDKVYVATKIPPVSPGAWPPSPFDVAEERFPESYLRERLERSLRDLQTDCIDILQLHTWTRAWNRDPKPLEILRKFKTEG
jgi:aryl-alcohol dehydrogenase-like predicted oxidoreductase